MELNKFIHKKPFIIAGPCSAESETQVQKIAKDIKNNKNYIRAWAMGGII